MANDDDLAIRTRALHKAYGSVAALGSLDLEVRRGEVFALLGPNGAGKTTAVEILEGFRSRTSGDAVVLGEDPGGAGREWRARIGLVLQSSKVSDEVTVREAITHFRRFYADPRRVEEVMELVGLTDRADVRADKLSGGQQRRLDVALGIVGRPELLFLDEPTTGFDPEARRQFWDLVRRLREEGTSILLTTHYLDEAEALADRVGVLAGGHLVETAAPADLGGRATAPAIVRWSDGDEIREVRSARPTAVIRDLAAQFGGEIPDLSVARPSLEDIYLTMIGTHTKEAS